MANTVDIVLRVIGGAQVASALGVVQQQAIAMRDTLTRGFALATTAINSAAVVAVRSAINYADEIAKLSARTAVSTETLSGLAHAANLSDVSFRELEQGVKGLVEWMERTEQGGRDVMEVLLETADIIAGMPDGAEKLNIAIDRFGRSAQRLMPLLNAGSAGIREATEEARRFGVVISSETAKQAEEFNDNLTRMATAAKGAALAVGRELMPEFIALQNAILEFQKAQPAWVAALFRLVSQEAERAVMQLVRFLGGIKAISEFVSGFWDNITNRHLGPIDAATDAWGRATEAVHEYLRALTTPTPDAPRTPTDPVDARDQATEFELAEARISSLQFRRALAEQSFSWFEGIRQRERVRKLLEEELDLTNELVALRQKEFEALVAIDPEMRTRETLKAERELNQVLLDRAAIQQTLLAPPSGSFVAGTQARFDEFLEADSFDRGQGFRGGMMAGIQSTLMQLGTDAEIIGRTIQTSIGGAIDGISDGISGLILGTRTWLQTLQQIGSTILTTVISAISRMFTEWIVKRLLLSRTEQAASTAEAAAAAPKTLMTSISSWGVAAAVGAAAFVAAMALAGGFARGGYTGDMPADAPAGIVHGREFVFSAPAVERIGLPNLEALHEGRPMAQQAGDSQPMRVVIVDNRRDAEELRRDPRFRSLIVDLMEERA